MTQLSLVPRLDLHDAVLDALAIEWSTRVCVMHLRGVGPNGGRPIRIRWHGLQELRVSGEVPWGGSSSVLEASWDADGADEIRMQSDDVIRVRAEGRAVEADAEPLALRYGALAVDALADTGLVERTRIGQAVAIVAEEIRVRRSVGDV